MNEKEKFIADLYGPARSVSLATGVSWQTILAQAAQETGWGKHVLRGTNNIFNIKADKSWHGARKTFRVWEIENGHKVWRDQDFRVYKTTEEALLDRIDFLQGNPRYAKAGFFDPGNLGSLPLEAAALQRARYATDPHYAQNLSRLFNGTTMQHAIALAQARDHGHVGVKEQAPKPQDPKDGSHQPEGALGVERLQHLLTGLGYRDAHNRPLHIDGNFGRHTREALLAFQHAHGLPEVGHAGPRTRSALRRSEQSPSPVDPVHPDHALQQEISRQVDALAGRLNHQPQVQLRRLKAVLLTSAREHGVERVDHLVLGRDGESLFVVQGRLDDPAHRRLQVSLRTAFATPLSRSRQRLEQAEFQCLRASEMPEGATLGNEPTRAPEPATPHPQLSMR